MALAFAMALRRPSDGKYNFYEQTEKDLSFWRPDASFSPGAAFQRFSGERTQSFAPFLSVFRAFR